MLQLNKEVNTSRVSEDVNMQGSMAHEPPQQEGKMLIERCTTSSTGSTGNSSNKKKKGKAQVFYCCDFPPCNLSFTRSEHLARHIRKHTGEKPFQCHCSRRFSRLDNLRQHAQSIHQNEKIPEDSLATFGIKSQRLNRTDKGRAVGNRIRAYTADSQRAPIREHKRNSWSVSSIGSIGSAYSASHEKEAKLPILHLTNPEENAGLSDSDLPSIKQQQQQSLSPVEFSLSPISGTVLASSESSSWKSGFQSSPNSFFPRHVDPKLFQIPSHRLSFPLPLGSSSVSSCQETSGPPISGNPCKSTQFKNSPTMTTSSFKLPLRETSTQTEESSRRRTWHPDASTALNIATSKSNSSSLFSQDRPTQSPISPSIALSSKETLWLPGIESFGSPDRPKTPPPRKCSILKIDAPSPNLWHTQDYHQGQRSVNGEQGNNRNMRHLEINSRERTSSLTNESYRNSHDNSRQRKLTTTFKHYTYPGQPETSGQEDPRSYVKIPPIMLHNEIYVSGQHNLSGSHISSQMAELRVHSNTKSTDNVSCTDNGASLSLISPSTEHNRSLLYSNHGRAVVNNSEFGRCEQSISRPPYSTVPGTSIIYPIEFPFQSQRILNLNEKSNERAPISMRLDTLVASVTQ